MLADPAIGGFDTSSLLDAKSYEVAEQLEAFYADQPRDSLLVTYFSCHGVKDEDGRLYFAASNTKLDRLAATGVSSHFVQERMDRCRSRQIVLLLDCCYSGAFSRASRKSDRRVDVTDRLSGRGRIIITASTAMEYAFEGDHTESTGTGTSIFTRALVEGLRTGAADLDHDGQISVDDLYEYVHQAVRAVTPNQTPSMQADVEGAIYIATRPPGTAAGVGPAASPGFASRSSRFDRPATPWRVSRTVQGLLRDRRVLAAGVSLLVLSLVAVGLLVFGPWLRAPGWTSLPPLPEALEAAAVSAYDSRLWVAGGTSAAAGRDFLVDVHVYDPGTRVWRSGPPLPVATSHAALVSTGQQLFLVGGLTATGSTATVYRLDSPTARWVEDVPLPAARGAGAAVFDGHRIVFGGGVGTDGRAKADVWAFQDGRWRGLGQLSPGREKLASATDENGTAWFFGGRDPNAQETAYAQVDVVQAKAVKPAGTLTPVAGPAAVYWPGVGPCVIGGQVPDGFSADVVCQTPAPSTETPALTSPRAGLGAAVIDGSVYVVGGYDGGHHGSTTVEVLPAPEPR